LHYAHCTAWFTVDPATPKEGCTIRGLVL
jgi:hypothetical protein